MKLIFTKIYIYLMINTYKYTPTWLPDWMDIFQIFYTLLLWGLFFGNEEQRDRSLLFIGGVLLFYISALIFQILTIFIEPDYLYGICLIAILIYVIRS